METGTQETGTGKVRADRRIGKLIAFYESQLSSSEPEVARNAANKLTDILLKQAELRDRKEERECKLKLAGYRTAPPTTPAPTPQDLDEVIRQLQQEIAAKARNKQALATNDDSEKSFFD